MTALYNLVGLQNLKTHRQSVTVCTRCYMDKIRYAWAFGTVWPDVPIPTYNGPR